RWPDSSLRQRLTAACTQFVVEDLQPLNVVESRGFKRALEAVAGHEVDMPSRYGVKKHLGVMTKGAVETIRSALQGKRPALTADIWTSTNGTSYLNLSCRYIVERDGTCRLVSCTLGCEEPPESYTPVAIADKLKLMIKAFGIEETAISLTTDTTASMKAAITHHMPNQFWQDCAAHKIEVAIKPITEEKSIKATTALHNKVATHVKAAQKTREKLCRLQK
ncbi:unnamed protein product, partial [Laminaria digitata]